VAAPHLANRVPPRGSSASSACSTALLSRRFPHGSSGLRRVPEWLAPGSDASSAAPRATHGAAEGHPRLHDCSAHAIAHSASHHRIRLRAGWRRGAPERPRHRWRRAVHTFIRSPAELLRDPRPRAGRGIPLTVNCRAHCLRGASVTSVEGSSASSACWAASRLQEHPSTYSADGSMPARMYTTFRPSVSMTNACCLLAAYTTR
jgi:hypothetical protein